MTIRTVHDFPRGVRTIQTEWITLSDGTRLAAAVWLPEDAENDPVPAILEFLPYRRRDSTVLRDRQIHAYFAGHGYAGVRVDMRGSGDSDGILHDEYLPQEQADAVEVIAWLAAQKWCSGTVGMMGISWGGFNSLQVASHRPPALKAIITACSTDDRYADDCHFMGGCLLNNSIAWASTMFAYGAQPPDPLVVGERWRDLWLERLDNNPLMAATWIEHQTYDDYWKQGSVREDFSAITAAVYAVGGWADGYSNAIPRMLAGLPGPKKGLIGPWAHAWPHVAQPGPQIGFLQEALRWWDHWLKDIDNGIMDEPVLRAWMQESVRPATTYPERTGRWIAETSWPQVDRPARVLHLSGRDLADDPAENQQILIASSLATGITFGEWCPYGLAGELPADQRPDDGRSVYFDTAPLPQHIEIFGAPVVSLDIASDKPSAMIAARLEDVAPDGSSTLVTYGLLNLTHRYGHGNPEPLEPGKTYPVEIVLNDIAQAFPAGHRIRLALATSHWPIAWPAAELATLTLSTGESTLNLPIRARSPLDECLKPFAEPEQAEPEPYEINKLAGRNRTITEDPMTGETTVTVHRERASYTLPKIDLSFEADSEEHYRIREGDPSATTAETRATWRLSRKGWDIRTETATRVACTPNTFEVRATMKAYENGELVKSRDWDRSIPRL
ncbi:CocE/NonD family hydrolase [Mesorhizobium sp. ASY16-5R]|uniref:CocE/NonD family hydrolase n=1 Tax=Mesorhizobium sp. ASY16-5R TaxID=3445772 RepID=UPI003F9EC80F